MTTITQRLAGLRELMARRGVDAYLVPTADFHGSEYVGPHFKMREYLSGFTGSAGTLVVLSHEAGLWTDGRYLLQAKEELEGSGVTLYPMGQPGVPDIASFLLERLPRGGVVGGDGRALPARWCASLLEALTPKGVATAFEEDLAAPLWADRPPLPAAPVFVLSSQYAGQPAEEKLAAVRREMEALGATVHLLAALDEIMWLLNLRGGDIPCNPVALCYAAIETGRVLLFINEGKLPGEVREYLAGLGVNLRPYEGVYAYAAALGEDACVLLSGERMNHALYGAAAHARLIDRDSPILGMKAVKNPVELENLRRAHLRDGAALVKLLCWLKGEMAAGHPLTERQVAFRVDSLRMEQEGCLGPSFTTISGYGPHSAVVHYHATEESDVPLKPSGWLLLDSGGQYLEGTTDVTRTIALGPLSAEQKKHFTLVLKGMLRLSHTRFPRGCRGCHLDALARSPLWEAGLDFSHGTGHGIGYLLCVHEPPIGFAWRQTARYDTASLEPGMVLSDEPGVYLAGSHGVRIENQLAVIPAEQNEFGDFLGFETLTLAPIDLEAVEPSLLGEEERGLLNAYHARVCRELSPLLEEPEREWLRRATRPL